MYMGEYMLNNIRIQKEAKERQTLAEAAALSADTAGRLKREPDSDIYTCYETDRGRIIYSKAFRRLKHKTQVFISPQSDHMHTRLTHTLEVYDIADRIAYALNLNRDLTAAIALGHDLGHAPFGHAGEDALNEFCPPFEHNAQSLRVVDVLEGGSGLNLTYEVRDGILNHRSANSPATLEGKVVNFSDKIAYVNHDLDDALGAGVLTKADFPEEIFRELGESSRQRIDTMIEDIVLHSMGKGIVVKGEEIGGLTSRLRDILFEKLYLGSVAKARQEEKAKGVLKTLFEYFIKHPEEMPEEYIVRGEDDMSRSVCDYIAGMTDNYAIEKYEEIFIPHQYL